MISPVARVVEASSHSGVIVTGSSNVFTNNRQTIRVTDIHICPIHGVNIVITGSSTVFTNTLSTGRIADICSCGACIATGSPNVYSG